MYEFHFLKTAWIQTDKDKKIITNLRQIYQWDEIIRLSNLVTNHTWYRTSSKLGILLNIPHLQAFCQRHSQTHPPDPTVLGPKGGACNQPKERLLSLLFLHPIVNSGLEKRYLKGNELTPEACRLLSPEPGASGFPSQRIKEKSGMNEDRHFLTPFSQYFSKRLTFSSLHCCWVFLSYLD